MRDDTPFSEEQDHRARLRDFVESPPFRHTILAIIGLNAVVLGLETSPSAMTVAGEALHLLDTVILWIFVGELALRLYAHGLAFFRDPWGVFDFAVVTIALVMTAKSYYIVTAKRRTSIKQFAMRFIPGMWSALSDAPLVPWYNSRRAGADHERRYPL